MVITYIRGQARKLEHGFSRSVFGLGCCLLAPPWSVELAP